MKLGLIIAGTAAVIALSFVLFSIGHKLGEVYGCVTMETAIIESQFGPIPPDLKDRFNTAMARDCKNVLEKK